MRYLIILPGGSVRNKAWADGAEEAFGSYFDSVHKQYWEHWETGEENIDFSVELKKLQVATADFSDDVYVVAKSIGSIVALFAVQEQLINPTACAFFGMPFSVATELMETADWKPLEDLSVPTIAFHNDQDPISYDVTAAALQNHNQNIQLITRQADNHNYTEFEEMKIQVLAHFGI